MYITLINKETIFYNLVCISKVERHDKLAQILVQLTTQVIHDGRALSNTYVCTCMNICIICPALSNGLACMINFAQCFTFQLNTTAYSHKPAYNTST